ncbi:MAG: SufE family protein [Candidatus Shikimatogenerans bostrichidophilus]|nr:MAG: SufE family protein [Candidatus Shikimatogenerans bostrichidophilus]
MYYKILKKIKNKNIYNFLINIGKKLPKLSNKLKNKNNLIKKCLTKLWIYIYYKNNKIYIKGKSDSKIINGIIYLIIKYYSNKTIDYILNNKNDLFNKIKFNNFISINKYIGYLRIIKKIKEFAFNKQQILINKN